MASLRVKHDVIVTIKNYENATGAYENVFKEVDEVLEDLINNSGRLSYAFPPFIYSEVIRCIVNLCLSFFSIIENITNATVSSTELNGEFSVNVLC